MEIKDCAEAARALRGKDGRFRSGAIRTKDGAVLSGLIFDYEFPIDDPDGIGYFLLELADGANTIIYFDEFDALIDVW